jgi:hypothetical protein
VGYANPSLQPMSTPLCYSNFSDTITNQQCSFDEAGNLDCQWNETFSASVDVQFMGTDGQPHSLFHFDIPAETDFCTSIQGFPNDSSSCSLGTRARISPSGSASTGARIAPRPW